MSLRCDGTQTIDTASGRDWARNVPGAAIVGFITVDSFAIARAVWGAQGATGTTRLKLSVLTTGVISIRANALDSDATSAIDGVTGLNLSQRYHVASVIDFSTKTGFLYIDGALDAAGVFANMTAGNTSDTACALSKLGSQENGTSNRWLGELEDVRVYNRLLGPAEVQTIATGMGKDGIAQGLQARWPLNEQGEGVVPVSIADLSINGFGAAVTAGSPSYAGSYVTARKRGGRRFAQAGR